MLTRTSIPGFLNKVLASRATLWFPEQGIAVPKHNNILAVLGRPDGKILIPTHNIVTDAGDIYYAQLGAGEAPTNAFDVMVLAEAGPPGSPQPKSSTYADITPIAGTEKAFTATYPKTSDADADNTGAGVDIVTYLASYTKADFNHAAISDGVITNASPTASPAEPLLTMFEFASPFEKTANDTLKVFVNHEFLGV